MGLGRLTSNLITHTGLHKLNNQLVSEQLQHFGARTNHGQTQIHKTHHDLDLGKPPPSPLQYTLCLAIGLALKCHFVPRLPSGSPKIPIVRSTQVAGVPTLGAHNFVCKPPIKIRSEENLYPSSRAFQYYVARHMHVRKSGRFSTFSGQESNCQFDSQPFFWP